jgi:hypothetical protein
MRHVAKVMTAKMLIKAGRGVMRTGLAESTARAARARAAQARVAESFSTNSQRLFTAFRSAWLSAKTTMAGKVLAESVAVVPGIQGREVAQKWCSSRGGGGHATPTAEAAATMECNGRRH